MGEDGHVAARPQDVLDQRVGAGAHLGQRLAAGAAVAPQQPVGVALADDLVYRFHGFFFPDMTREHFALVHYGGMAALKVGAMALFAFPCVAILIVTRKKAG